MQKLILKIGVTVLIFLPLFGFSQNQGSSKIESLLQLLQTTKVDSQKAGILYKLSSEYKTVNPDEGIKYGVQSLQIIENKYHNTDLLIGVINCIGANYETKADYPNALSYYFKAISLSEQYKLFNEQYGNTLSNIGVIYFNQADYDNALKYYNKALAVFEHKYEKLGYANTLNGIATVFSSQKKYGIAESYYKKALEVNKKLDNIGGIAQILGNIGDNYKDQRNYSSAISNYAQSIQIYQDLNDEDGLGTELGSMGICFLAIAADTSFLPKGAVPKPANRLDTLKQAIKYISKGIALSQKVGDAANIINFSKALAEAYEAIGSYKDALYYNNYYLKLHDSVFSDQNNQKIKSLEASRERELKEKTDQFNAIKKRNERYAAIAGFILLSIIIIIIYVGLRRQKKYNKLLGIEKRKSDDLLLNILPSEVASELKEKGIAEAKYFENVTVLFTDFVGFTKIASAMSPKELVAELHICFKTFDEIMGKYHIEKIKTIGDAYMAISGLPVPTANHALKIVNAAIEINQFMTNYQSQKGELGFKIRIGIHSGNVVAGIVGVKKFAYDIWGDTVNTAARMEQNSLPGKINISEATYLLIKNQIKCSFRGEIEAKNKGMLKMYFVDEIQ
jgi:adenylate cyclase